ncbi:hypothetical protein Bpfe_012974 [Biomphalaria pfeifferi]|uniref:Secreted protein n=1 Tax=Biomphalaria pfeifferi TaxID=112525 RepID=A0AAD8BQ37_BIOPF|nr:hypothetical protein Bpfe_012974 [Biomphalaria pfeifferi]
MVMFPFSKRAMFSSCLSLLFLYRYRVPEVLDNKVRDVSIRVHCAQRVVTPDQSVVTTVKSSRSKPPDKDIILVSTCVLTRRSHISILELDWG